MRRERIIQRIAPFARGLAMGTFLWVTACSAPGPRALSEIAVPVASDLIQVGEGPSGMEGPAYLEGFLYFVNAQYNGSIATVDLASNSFEFFIDSLPGGSLGNAICVTSYKDLWVADYANHNVLSIDLQSREVSIHAHDDRMNQPNDLTLSSKGTLYASDPNWSEGTGQLWRIDVDGTTHLLEADMGTTNGIALSADEERLYVNESVQRNVWLYDVDPEGNLKNKRLHHQFADFGMDGMECDNRGNLYVTRHGKGTIAVLDASGELQMEITLTGKKPSNIAFGGPNGSTCYVTMQDRGYIETFEAPFPGPLYPPE
ncbi:MAG: SMP-30/gluconolactonase/LRE family protein [Bacteroidota bacterium]